MSVTRALAQLATQQGVTQRQLAQRLGCTQSTVHQLLHADDHVSLARVAKAAEALGYQLTIGFKRKAGQ